MSEDGPYAYDIADFAQYAQAYKLSESEANALYVTDYEENDYTKIIPYGSEIALTDIEIGVDDTTRTKSVWCKK